MEYTKLQISELILKHAEKENGLNDLMEIMLESMMLAERAEFLKDNPDNKEKDEEKDEKKQRRILRLEARVTDKEYAQAAELAKSADPKLLFSSRQFHLILSTSSMRFSMSSQFPQPQQSIICSSTIPFSGLPSTNLYPYASP